MSKEKEILGTNKPSAFKRNKKIAILDTVNITNFNIPSKIKYANVSDYAHESMGETNAFPELAKYSKDEEKWKERLKKGKLISINDPIIGGIENIMDGWTDIRECIGWKLVRIENNLLNKEICHPIVVKRKDEQCYFLDGRTRACVFHVFNVENQEVYLLDLTEDEEDFIENAKKSQNNMKTAFDYQNIKEEHQALVRDIIDRLDNGEQNSKLKTELSLLFKLEDEDEYNFDKSIFINYAKRVGLSTSKQGHITVKEGEGKPVNYPVVSVCDDIRKLNDLIEEVMKDVMIQVRETQNNGSK